MKSLHLSWPVFSLALVLPVFAGSGATELKNQFNDPIQINGERINYPQQYFAAKQEPASAGLPQLATTAKAAVTMAVQAEASGEKPIIQLLDLFALGYGLGINGLYSGDYNEDSVSELILANSDNISIVELKSGKFEPVNQIRFTENIMQSHYFHSASTDSHYVIFSSASGGEIQKLNLHTRQTEEQKLTIRDLTSTGMAQAQGDEQKELLIRTWHNSLHIYDPASFQLLKTYQNIEADIAATGAFTDKEVSELLLTNGKIYRFENGGLALQKTLNSPMGDKNLMIDVNGDGISELLSADTWGTIRLIDTRQDAVLWTHQPDLDIAAVTIADLDQDGALDIIYGDGQWGNLYALKASNGEEFWSIGNPNHGVTNIIVADLDNDGKQDIGWGGGYTSSGADNFYIHDVATKAQKWISESLDMPAQAVALSDVDQNGTLDAIYATNSSNSSYGAAIIKAYDTDSKAMLWSAEAAPNNWGRTMNIVAADLDNEGSDEIIIGASEIYTSLIRVIDAKDGSLRYAVELGDGDSISDLLVTDVDADGFNDIVVTNRAEHTGSQGSFFTVLDGRTGAVKKVSPGAGFSWDGLNDLTLLEIAGTTGPDIFALSSGLLYNYNYAANTIKRINTAESLQQLTVATREGVPGLFATTDDGTLYSVTLAGSMTKETSLCAGPVTGINTAYTGKLIFNCANTFGEYNLDTGTVEFELPAVGVSGTPEMQRFNNQDYYIVGGDKVGVYTSTPAAVLPAPASLELSTHVLKSVTGTLQIEGGADYYVLEGQPTFGQFSFTDRKTGQFTYQPRGTTGQDKVTFYAIKSGSQSPKAELTVNLTNQVPVAETLNVSTHWSTPLTLTLAATDGDEEALTYQLINQPSQGKVTLTSATKGTVEYVPSTTQLEPVSFNYTARDSLVASEVTKVIITLTNTAPVANTLSYNTSYTSPVNGRLTGTDQDGDALIYQLVSQPTSGSLTLDNETGLFVYTPAGDNDQQITFSYVVKDKFAQSEVQNVNISIKGKEKSGGSIGYAFMLLLMLLAGRTLKHKRSPSSSTDLQQRAIG